MPRLRTAMIGLKFKMPTLLHLLLLSFKFGSNISWTLLMKDSGVNCSWYPQVGGLRRRLSARCPDNLFEELIVRRVF